MSDLFGNHIVGFPTRRLICFICYMFYMLYVIWLYGFICYMLYGLKPGKPFFMQCSSFNMQTKQVPQLI